MPPSVSQAKHTPVLGSDANRLCWRTHTHAGYGDTVDVPGAKAIPDMLKFFKSQFDQRYNGSRVPFQINMIVGWCATPPPG